ncbi:deubiquitinase MYSM1-like [Adelges cooleyi]|uniref:deubiquitinase MYSM1-like n=1 Tax=Adelges cooleyi TaxID=133065 RepID=UPI00217F6DBF|nr:deubiquitinase MYSM1-like [Adelges cooleyi]
MDDEIIDVITECSFDYLESLYEPWNKTETTYNRISPQWLIQLADDWNSEHNECKDVISVKRESRKLKKRLSEDACDESKYREILNKYKENDVFVLPNGEELVRVRKDSNSESEIDIMEGESMNNNNNSTDWRSIKSNVYGSRDIESLPAPTREKHLDNNIITADERCFHPNIFGKKDDKKYLKIRNTILELWKVNKPDYVSKTLAKQKLKKCGTAKEVGQVHTYLEHKGYINFGCDECKYNKHIKKESNVRRNRELKTNYNLKPIIAGRYNKSYKKIKELGGYTISHEKITAPQWEHNYSVSKQRRC